LPKSCYSPPRRTPTNKGASMPFIEVRDPTPANLGYAYVMENSTERIMGDDYKTPRVIEVRGPYYLVATGKGMTFDVVAVLTGEDVRLHKLLQWQNEWRWHGDVSAGNFMEILIVWALLTAIHIVAAFAGFFGGFPWAPVCAVLLPIVEIVIALLAWPYLCATIGIMRTLAFVVGQVRRGKTRAYYHELFERLSGAGSEDRAYAARIMARLV
jgi:hypothetical protein